MSWNMKRTGWGEHPRFEPSGWTPRERPYGFMSDEVAGLSELWPGPCEPTADDIWPGSPGSHEPPADDASAGILGVGPDDEG